MMSKTHLTVGMAAALLVATVQTPAECALALAGGAIGGVLADVDTLRNDYKADALVGELLAFGVFGIVAILDNALSWGIIQRIMANGIRTYIGLALLIGLWIFGFTRQHRTFTHSLLAMVLYSACFALMKLEFGYYCMAGYFSHLALDLLNKKGIRLFFPLKIDLCFNLCYASKKANTVFLYIGLAATFLLLIFRIIMICFVTHF